MDVITLKVTVKSCHNETALQVCSRLIYFSLVFSEINYARKLQSVVVITLTLLISQKSTKSDIKCLRSVIWHF